MITHPPLPQTPAKAVLVGFGFLVYGEAMQQHLGFVRANVLLGQDRRAGGPRNRNRRIINIEQAITVAESILRQNDVLLTLAQNANIHAPTLDGHVYAAEAVAKAFSYGGIIPLDLDEVSSVELFDVAWDFFHVVSQVLGGEGDF
jgi:hypothetical protein